MNDIIIKIEEPKPSNAGQLSGLLTVKPIDKSSQHNNSELK